MQSRPVHFFSDRIRLDGNLHTPDGSPDSAVDRPLPAVVACSGFQGLKQIHPERFARGLTPHGYAVLTFDYRGFGYSEGERGRVVPQEQVEDVRAAISYLAAQPQVDSARIGLVGWALGGGVVIAEAADDPRVQAVATCNAIGDGRRSIEFTHDEHSWHRLLANMDTDRAERARSGRSRCVHPWEIVRLDRDTRTNGYVADELYRAPNFGGVDVSLESADYYFRFRPEDVVKRLAGRPLLLVHGAENRLHSPEESRRLYDQATEPKRLVLLQGRGHTEWMFDEHPIFQKVATTIREFLDTHLRGQLAVTN